MTTTAFMWRIIRSRPGLYATNCLLWGVFHALPLLTGLALQHFFNNVTSHHSVNLWFWSPLAVLVAIQFVRISIFFTGIYQWVTLWFLTEMLLRKNMFRGILRWPGRNLPGTPGEAVSRFRDDAQEVVAYLESWTDFWGRLVYFTVSIVIMVRINWVITVAAVVPLFIVTTLNTLSGKRARRFSKANREATARITSFIGDVFGSVLTVKLGGASFNVLERFEDLNEQRRRAALNDSLFTEWMRSLGQHVLNISAGIILLLGAAAMRDGRFTVGDFALFTAYLGFFSYSVSLFGYMFYQHKRLRVSIDRMSLFFPDRHTARLTEQGPLYEYEVPPNPEPTPLHPEDSLQTMQVRGLTYRYPNSVCGIDSIDLSLERGSFTVITGRVGAGKTTLLRSLLGLLPMTAGTIHWNGKQVENPAAFFTPPKAAYTPQVPRLFSDPLLDNILQGVQNYETRLSAAVEGAVMEHDIDMLGDGLQTVVGPRGVMLSGGQVQRAATARMLVTHSELLVFDDLSSALDVETERLVWERLYQQRNVTCLAVSHRRAALTRADRILVLKDGRLIDSGSLDALLSRCEEMRLLWGLDSSDSDRLGEPMTTVS